LDNESVTLDFAAPFDDAPVHVVSLEGAGLRDE
jgi:predicted secreted protein